MPKQTFFNLPAAKQEQLTTIAIEEFANNDYQNASVRRIIEKCGIAPGSFYQYFADKQDLYAYLFVLMAEAKKAFFAQSNPPESLESDIFAYLRWLAETSAQFELSQPLFSQMAYRALKNNSFPDDMVREGQQKGDSFLHDLVAQGKAQGRISSVYDDELVVFLFNMMLSELGQYMMRRRQTEPEDGQRPFLDPNEPNNLFAQTITILEHGLRGSQE